MPVVPVAHRGTFAAMPRGQGWPARGRRQLTIRFGEPLRRRTRRVRARVRAPDQGRRRGAPRRGPLDLVGGQAPRGAAGATPDPTGPEVAQWRRVWEQTESPAADAPTRSSPPGGAEVVVSAVGRTSWSAPSRRPGVSPGGPGGRRRPVAVGSACTKRRAGGRTAAELATGPAARRAGTGCPVARAAREACGFGPKPQMIRAGSLRFVTKRRASVELVHELTLRRERSLIGASWSPHRVPEGSPVVSNRHEETR